MKRESTMIRLALTVLPLAPAGAAHAQQVPPYTIRRPNAGFTISFSANPRMVAGTVHSKKTPRESFGKKSQVF
jgi:hypothetical protein